MGCTECESYASGWCQKCRDYGVRTQVDSKSQLQLGRNFKSCIKENTPQIPQRSECSGRHQSISLMVHASPCSLKTMVLLKEARKRCVLCAQNVKVTRVVGAKNAGIMV